MKSTRVISLFKEKTKWILQLSWTRFPIFLHVDVIVFTSSKLTGVIVFAQGEGIDDVFTMPCLGYKAIGSPMRGYSTLFISKFPDHTCFSEKTMWFNCFISLLMPFFIIDHFKETVKIWSFKNCRNFLTCILHTFVIKKNCSKVNTRCALELNQFL